MFQGSKIINDCSKNEVNSWYQYNSMHMKEDNYVNVLANEEKSKYTEWMKSNKLHRQPKTAPHPDCCLISHFVWDPNAKTWQPKYEI